MFPLQNYNLEIPTSNEVGGFGYVRTHDIHTGVDLYCKEGTSVHSMHDGKIVYVDSFTGFQESPWWNDTWCIIVDHKKFGFVLYGEIKPQPHIKRGLRVSEGEVLGTVMTVLKETKHGQPFASMLHMELYTELREPVWWYLNQPQHKSLKDPYWYLMQIRWQDSLKKMKSCQ